MKKFKVGLIGCGHISVTHLKGWQKAEACEVTGVFDVNVELARQRAKAFGVGTIYESVEALIAGCDVVDVCTPPQTHSEIASKVIEAGRHLVIEKPLVTDVGDWDRLKRMLSHSPGSITVIHNLKFTHCVQTAKRWVDEGRVGDIISLNRQFLTNPETDRMLVGNTHWSHSLPGGRWFETMPHELYLFHHFVGPLELDHVSALHTPQAPAGAPADEVMVTLKNGRCIGAIQYSANCSLNKRMLYIYGTKGAVTVDLLSDYAFLSTSADQKWKRAVGLSSMDASRALLRAIPDRSGYLLRQARGDNAHANIIRAFDSYVQGKGPAPTSTEEVDYVVRNCDKIGWEIDKQVGTLLAA
jgi:predicted dehydrogenase